MYQGLIPEEGYMHVASKGLEGVIAQIDESGEVANVSFGTAMGPNLQFYKDIPITSMPYGQALAMLALVEWERLQGAQK
jgi:unsaturated rhamnogalacturonyl hydrolase